MICSFLPVVVLCGLLNVSGVSPCCGPPDSDDNTNYYPVKTRYEVGEVVSYYCESGYIAVGGIYRYCLVSCEWGSSAPTCQVVAVLPGCLRPSDPTHGSVSSVQANKGQFSFNEFVTYRCDAGYCIGEEQNADVYCHRYIITPLFYIYRWSHAPTCHECPSGEGGCSRPSDPTDGSVHSDPPNKYRFAIDEWVIYRCDEGYYFDGDSSVYCRENGWTHLPTCQREIFTTANDGPSGCTRPSNPVRGSVHSEPANKNVFAIGESVVYRCINGGYCPDGNSSVTCLEDGWSHTPSCLHCCHRQSDPRYGSIHSDPPNKRYFALDEWVIYRCDDGYYIDSDSSVYCREGGWSHAPECLPSGCGRPFDPSDGSIHSEPPNKSQFDIGEWVIYRCEEGFCLDGDSSVYCQENGWSHSPSCRRCCDRPINPENGSVHSDQPNKQQFTVDDWVIYRCNEGYHLVGDSSVYCRYSGWSHAPTCTRGCVYRDAPGNGSYVPEGKTSWYPGDVATFSCDVNYHLDGYSNSTCSHDYIWDRDVPTCRRGCPRPTNPINGYVESSLPDKELFHLDEYVTYRCSAGYHLQGAPRVDCLRHGWSHTPTCAGYLPTLPPSYSCRNNCGRLTLGGCGCDVLCPYRIYHQCCNDYGIYC